jgi:hypothetical protein
MAPGGWFDVVFDIAAPFLPTIEVGGYLPAPALLLEAGEQVVIM